MSDTAWAESLLSRFVVPLVCGGEVHVGAPLGTRGALRFKESLASGLDDTPSGIALRAARQVELEAIGCSGEAPPLLDDVMAPPLLVALHDLLFLQHQGAARLKLEARHAVLRSAQRLAEQAQLAPELGDLTTLYGRHSLLGRLFTLERNDTRRLTSDGAQVWKGVKAPRRWLSFSDAEDEVQRVAVLPELVSAQSGPGAELVQALLWASPLTDLYHPVRPACLPPVDLLAHAGWLGRAAVARLLTRRYLELGLSTVGPVLAGGIHGCLVYRVKGASAVVTPPLAAWICLSSHLHLVAHVVGKLALPAASAPSETLDFYSLFAAVYAARPELAMPPDAAFDSALRPAIEQHAARCQALVGASRVHTLLPLLGKSHVETV